MSKTVAQIYLTNPTTVVADTDLYYLVQSPYTPGSDAAITGASLKAAFGTGGTISPGLVNQLGYYASAGTTISGLATLADGVLITSALGAPSISQTLPSTVQGNITTLGTISSGIWNGSVISGTYGGTGVNNGTKTITIGGNFAMSGAFTFAGTLTGNTAVTFPTTGTLATTADLSPYALKGANADITSMSGLTGKLQAPTAIADSGARNVLSFSYAGSAVNYFDMANSAAGAAITLDAQGADTDIIMRIQSKGNKWLELISQTGTSPIKLWPNTSGGNLWKVAFDIPSLTGDQVITLPDGSGTLAFTSGIPTGAALTKTDDTNVTLMLGGSPTTALVNAASLTLGWAGTLSGTRGGTGVNNGASTMTIGGNFSMIGAFTFAGTITGNTAVTFPTSGTLATTSQLLTSPLTTKGDIWVWSTTNDRLPVATGDGKILQVSSGAATGLAYSTPTYPSASGSAGKLLRSDGTNNVYTTSTFSDTYTASNLLYSNGSNTVTGLSTANNGLLVTSATGVPSILAGPGTTGNMIISNAAAAPSFTTFTYPTTIGASGSIYISNGTNIVSSTSLWPNTVGSAGTIIRSDGTTNAYTTTTYPNTNAINTIMYASSANVLGVITPVNSAVMISSSGGVPSMSTTLPSGIAATSMALTTPAFTGVPTGTVTSGSYTPTISNIANVSASTANACVYTRVGDVVAVSGTMSVDAVTTLTITQVRISLPIASNFTGTTDGAGVLASSVANAAGRIESEGGSDTMQCQWIPVSTANDPYGFTFQYIVK